jgi:hypothetical protein
VNPARLYFISITFSIDGLSQQIIFSPYESVIGFPSWFNRGVVEWFDVIRESIIASTGRAPATTPVHKLDLPAGSRLASLIGWIPSFCVILLLLSMVFLIRDTNVEGHQNDWRMLLSLGALVVMILMPILIVFLFFRLRNNRDRTNSNRIAESTGNSTASSWLVGLVLVFTIMSGTMALLGSIVFWTLCASYSPPPVVTSAPMTPVQRELPPSPERATP